MLAFRSICPRWRTSPPSLPSIVDVRCASRSTMKKREKQRAAQLYRNERQAAANKLQKWANLHPAAKMKRVISLCGHWFGKNNLPNDAFIVNTMVEHDGWMPLHTLLSFPRIEFVNRGSPACELIESALVWRMNAQTHSLFPKSSRRRVVELFCVCRQLMLPDAVVLKKLLPLAIDRW